MSFLIHKTKACIPARVYCGMWIVDCPTCRNAWQLARFHPSWDCSYCGNRYEVVWPDHDTALSIERLLLMRPLPYTQNWLPGETLHDLMQENAAHGVFDVIDPIAQANPGAALLTVTDDTIRTDRLPLTRQRELKAVTS